MVRIEFETIFQVNFWTFISPPFFVQLKCMVVIFFLSEYSIPDNVKLSQFFEFKVLDVWLVYITFT